MSLGTDNTKFNATKHGLTGTQIVIKGEDPAIYDALRAKLVAEHQPATEEEAMLVEHIAQSWWKLQRAGRYEQQLMNNAEGDIFSSRGWQNFQRYRNAVERSWNRARKELAALQSARRKAAAKPKPQNEKSVLTLAPPPPPKYTAAELALRL